MEELWNERFWNYTFRNYTHHVKTIKQFMMSLYDDAKRMTQPEIEQDFTKILVYALVMAYTTGACASYVKLNKFAEKFVSWRDYRPEQWAFLEHFVENNFDSIFWGLPAGQKRRVISNMFSFLPDSAMLDVLLWYATHFTASMSEKLQYLVQDRTADGRKDFSAWALMVATAEFVRAYQWGIVGASYKLPDVVGFLFVAVIDEKTSRFCKPRHMMFIPRQDKQKVIRNCPPLHPHCRSVLEPVTQKVGYERDDLLMPQPPYYSPNEHILWLLMNP